MTHNAAKERLMARGKEALKKTKRGFKQKTEGKGSDQGYVDGQEKIIDYICPLHAQCGARKKKRGQKGIPATTCGQLRLGGQEY